MKLCIINALFNPALEVEASGNGNRTLDTVNNSDDDEMKR